MELIWSKCSVWIIEFGRPDGYYISTLIFTLKSGIQKSSSPIIEEFLNQAITPQGGWDTLKIKSITKSQGVCTSLLKHFSQVRQVWGYRLHKESLMLLKEIHGQNTLF